MAELFFTDFRFDTRAFRLEGTDGEIEIRPKTLELLVYLIENRNRFVPRKELMGTLWPDVVVTASSLTQCVSELRQALGDSTKDPRYIETRIKKGYRFKATVYHQPTRMIEDIPPPQEFIGERNSRVWKRNVFLLSLLVGLFFAGLSGWWFLGRSVPGRIPVVIRLVAFDSAEGPDAGYGERLRQDLIRELGKLPQLELSTETETSRQGFKIEIECRRADDEYEVSAILRDRKNGEALWGWNWVLSAEHGPSSDTTAKIVGTLRKALLARLP